MFALITVFLLYLLWSRVCFYFSVTRGILSWCVAKNSKLSVVYKWLLCQMGPLTLPGDVCRGQNSPKWYYQKISHISHYLAIQYITYHNLAFIIGPISYYVYIYIYIVRWRIHMVVIFTYCGLAWSFVQVAWQYQAITWTNLYYLQSNMIFHKTHSKYLSLIWVWEL